MTRREREREREREASGSCWKGSTRERERGFKLPPERFDSERVEEQDKAETATADPETGTRGLRDRRVEVRLGLWRASDTAETATAFLETGARGPRCATERQPGSQADRLQGASVLGRLKLALEYPGRASAQPVTHLQVSL